MGPGFDCLGIALSLYNVFELEYAEQLSIQVYGEGEDSIARDEQNLLVRSYRTAMGMLGKQAPNLRITQKNSIPSTMGLGSSSTAVVAGVMAANILADAELTQEELLYLAARIEGHPDNVAPALFGGFTISFMEIAKAHFRKISVPEEIAFVAMIPNQTLNTNETRAALEDQISRKDGVFNLSRSTFMAAAIAQGDYAAAAAAMEDRWHQQQRGKLICGYDQVHAAMKKHGAMASFLSGAGPCIMAMTTKAQQLELAQALEQSRNDIPGKWKILPLSADNSGVKIERV